MFTVVVGGKRNAALLSAVLGEQVRVVRSQNVTEDAVITKALELVSPKRAVLVVVGSSRDPVAAAERLRKRRGFVDFYETHYPDLTRLIYDDPQILQVRRLSFEYYADIPTGALIERTILELKGLPFEDFCHSLRKRERGRLRGLPVIRDMMRRIKELEETRVNAKHPMDDF